MKKRGLLCGAYWFTMYTTFFAIISLLYYVLENPSSPTSQELFREALEGREVLAHFAKKSMAADRCTVTLNSIFGKLPEKVKQDFQSEELFRGKKRRQGSPQSLHSRLKQDDFVSTGLRRASTFPETMPDSKNTAGQTLPISQSHLASLGVDPAYGRPPSQSGSEFYGTTPSLTPSSTTTSLGWFGGAPTHTPQQRPIQSFGGTPLSNTYGDPTATTVPLSDVNAMMFPSTDPFAYPNQPMTTFENTHPHQFKSESSPALATQPFQVSNMDMKPSPASFSPVPMGPRRPQDNNVQLFGPMPMYLMHGAQQQSHSRFQPRLSPHNVQMADTPEAANMNFDDLIGGEEWANTFMDPSLGLGGAGNGYGGNPNYGPGGPGMQNWR